MRGHWLEPSATAGGQSATAVSGERNLRRHARMRSLRAYDAISSVWANVGMGGSCDPPHECLSTVGGLGDIRFMLFAGCESGLDGRVGTLKDGNLVDVAKYYGVDNVWGFTSLVYWPMGMDFASFLGIELKNGSTVDQAMWKAGQDVKNRWFGNAHGWTSQYGRYIGGSKVVPAAYGS